MASPLKSPLLNKEQREFIEKTETLFKYEDNCPGVQIVVTDNMTPEEEEFEIISGFIRGGCSIEEAKEKAKELLKVEKEIFRDTN